MSALPSASPREVAREAMGLQDEKTKKRTKRLLERKLRGTLMLVQTGVLDPMRVRVFVEEA